MKNCVFATLLTQVAALAVPSISARSGEIVGGQRAKIEDFPYQVNYQLNDEPDCGGTILNKRYVVTAAHCTYRHTASELSILVGSADLNGGTRYQVEAIYQNPKFVRATFDYDVSVLKLASDLVFGPTVKAIGGLADTSVATGTQATVSGWGSLHEGEYDSDTLQYVKVPIFDQDTCNSDYDNAITDRMICAAVAEGGKDSCQGDSGGPLVVNNKLVGIVSWGEGCARPGKPGIYTDVSNKEIHDFIRSKAGL